MTIPRLFQAFFVAGICRLCVGLASGAPAPAPADYTRLGFDILGGFKYTIPEGATGDQAQKMTAAAARLIPANIRRYDGCRAWITGFMLPVKMEDGTGLVTDFLLVRDPMMCCYGVVPDPNDWVVVHMDKAVTAIQDVPISFVGTLHVGPIYDNGYLSGIYRLEGERLAANPP